MARWGYEGFLPSARDAFDDAAAVERLYGLSTSRSAAG
jgi:hypothetical protein